MIDDRKIIRMLTEELEKRDVVDMFKKDKDFEKRVKEIVSDAVLEMFRILYQHNNLFKALAH